MDRRTAAAAALVALAVLAGAGVLVYRSREAGEDARLRAFFTLPTPAVCATASAVSPGQARFAAFVPGDESLKSVKGKFLIVPFNASGPAVAGLAQHVVLAAPTGAHYRPLPLSNVSSELIFDIPRDLAAAKLVFDDGCTHQEWLAP